MNEASATGRAVVASFGGTALGDVAFVPGMGLKEPKGIRSVVEWYMSTVMRQEYLHEIFRRQTDIAIANYEKLWAVLGDKVDVVLTCGTDFGSQESQFCSVEVFNELWLPHYRRMNDWIHEHTTWKVFKHSCGAIVPILPGLIEAGFDIINPVQINAKGMDSEMLKREFGSHLTFGEVESILRRCCLSVLRMRFAGMFSDNAKSWEKMAVLYLTQYIIFRLMCRSRM